MPDNGSQYYEAPLATACWSLDLLSSGNYPERSASARRPAGVTMIALSDGLPGSLPTNPWPRSQAMAPAIAAAGSPRKTPFVGLIDVVPLAPSACLNEITKHDQSELIRRELHDLLSRQPDHLSAWCRAEGTDLWPVGPCRNRESDPSDRE
jgi:hypothetical protein